MVSATPLRSAGAAGVHDGSREALLRNESVVPALEVVKEAGLSAGVRDIAADALRRWATSSRW